MKFRSFSFAMVAFCLFLLTPFVNLNAQCLNVDSWGTAFAPNDNTTAIITDCNYAGEYGTIENIVMGNIYVVSSSICSDYISIYDENENLVQHGNAPVAFFAMSSGNYQAHFSVDENCTTNNDCRETSVNCISCGAVPGCTDPVAENYDPNADFGQCNCTYSVPDNDECAYAIDLTSFINADGSCTSIHVSDNIGATNSAGEIQPSGACVGGDPNPKDVWFMVEAPAHGSLTFEFIATPGFSSIVELYTGICGSLLPYEPVNCTNSAIRTFEGLEAGTMVYLRVWDFDSDEFGVHEICIKRTPYCPFLSSPFGNNVPVDSDLSWEAENGATGYNVQIGTSPGDDDILEMTDAGNVLTYEPGLLAEGTTYYVSVFAYNDLGYTNTCQEFNFTTSCGSIVIDADISDAICFGDANGAIDVTVSNGSGEYYFSWNGSGGFVSEEEDPQNLIAGLYSLTVTDEENECIGTSFFVVESNDPILDNFLIFDAGCEDDGEIDLTVEGGAGNFTFDWSTGAQSEDLENLPAGFYSVTITDQLGCERVVENIEILEIGLEVNILNIQPVGCAVSTGSIELSPDNGVGPFNYSWVSDNGLHSGSVENVEQGYLIEELPEGIYDIMITDSGGCELNLENVEVGSSTELQLSYTITDIGCNNEESGAITAFVDNGIPPYQVLFSNGMNTNINAEYYELTGLSGGNYSVTVTDAVGCVGISSNMIINEPEPLQVSVQAVESLTCPGDQNGKIDIQVDGGTEPYTFQWSSGSDLEDLDQIGSGHYQVTISDVNLCTIVSPVLEITTPEPIALVVEGVQHVSCFNEDDGTINSNIIGGTPPYGIEWNNSSINEDLSALSEGVYQATITDFNGCTSISPEIEITSPDEALQIEESDQLDISCFGSQDGRIDLTISGGVPPFTYQWSNGAETQDISDLSTGNYLITITDFNGCNIISPVFFISEPRALTYEVSSTAELQGQANGTATIEVEGGAAPYTILWDSNAGAQNTASATGLAAGIYQVYVKDDNDCDFFAEVEVGLEIPTGTHLPEVVESIRVFPNPTDGKAVLQIELKEPVDMQIELLDLRGKILSQFTQEQVLADQINIDVSDYPKGIYLVQILMDGQDIVNRKLIKQ